ncbi:HHR177Cp [Eremothecium sinecaudum]|uniref:Palmitoyltransferase n=1 Tax=Eremothecium sinecaudum TaxID=45286 RepID=A0A0X8HWE3_9SACH|nr:HHR177Cp [Eremothecium sinecaudum]AMD22946.1 HHR177Cp [Eremothecium sinecaudum]
MHKSLTRFTRHRWYRFFLPSVVFVLMLYCSWVYCHLFCIVELHNHLGLNVTPWVLMGIHLLVQVLVWYILVQIIAVGPGRQPKVLPFRIYPDTYGSDSATSKEELEVHSIIPPDVYQCDIQGYPIWCSTCQSLKIDRAHHSAPLGYCVPRFDHYCVWVGTAIGRKNYRLFIQYLFYFVIYAGLIAISIGVFARRIINYRNNNGLGPNVNIFVVLGMTGLGFCFVALLFMSFTFYMVTNRTSIETIMNRGKPTRRTCYCIYNLVDGYRYVLDCNAEEHNKVWANESIWENITGFIGPRVWMWFIPFGSNIPPFKQPSNEANYDMVVGPYLEKMSKKYKQSLMDRIQEGNYLTRLRAYGDNFR